MIFLDTEKAIDKIIGLHTKEQSHWTSCKH